MKPWRCLWLLCALPLVSLVQAHATLVLVEMQLAPTVPSVELPLEVSLELIDPFQVPVEDAIIRLEARPIRNNGTVPEDAALVAIMEEDEAGRYVARLELAQASEQSERWKLFFRDQTYPYEEATKNVDLTLGQSYEEGIDFIFPPTQTQPRSIWTWLGWLIGLPVAVAGFVTVAVLVNHKRDSQADTASA